MIYKQDLNKHFNSLVNNPQLGLTPLAPTNQGANQVVFIVNIAIAYMSATQSTISANREANI